MGEKTVIHNYGHGGCGITLSWGTAKLAVDLAVGQPHRKIAVVPGKNSIQPYFPCI